MARVIRSLRSKSESLQANSNYSSWFSPRLNTGISALLFHQISMDRMQNWTAFSAVESVPCRSCNSLWLLDWPWLGRSNTDLNSLTNLSKFVDKIPPFCQIAIAQSSALPVRCWITVETLCCGVKLGNSWENNNKYNIPVACSLHGYLASRDSRA